MMLQIGTWTRRILASGVVVLCVGMSAGRESHCAAAPGYAMKPAVVEYDVDPSWPKVPQNLDPWGPVTGMAIDDKDQVWLLSRCKDPVQVYAADGTFVRTWGRGVFDSPHQLRIDPEGNIWVSDYSLHVVQKHTPEGKLLLSLGVRGEQGNDQTHFGGPTDMVITKTGEIFVTDGYVNRRVVHFDRNGKFVKAWGSYGTKPDQFVLPHSIVVDSKGTLYVGDRNSGRILLFDQDGKPLDQWSSLIMPWGLSITSSDEIWVCGSSPHWWRRHGEYCEYKDQVIMRFSTDGRLRRLWAIPLGEKDNLKPGETIGAHCIGQDSKGNVYLGEAYGNRAQKFVPVSSREEKRQ